MYVHIRKFQIFFYFTMNTQRGIEQKVINSGFNENSNYVFIFITSHVWKKLR